MHVDDDNALKVTDTSSPGAEPADTKNNPLGKAELKKSSESTTQSSPAEIGGRDGPEPTRFGDWEKNGRCIDF